MNTISYFEIQSSIPSRDKVFYSKVFGWEFILVDSLPIEYYRIVTNGISGGLLKRPVPIPPTECGTNAFTCSIEVADYDKTEKQILESGGRIAMPKFPVTGQCWQGYYIDPDNNTFGITQVDETAG